MVFGDKPLNEDEEILKQFEEIRRSAARPQIPVKEDVEVPVEEPKPVETTPNEMQNYLSELKRLQDIEQDNLRNVALFQAADKISRSLAAGYGGQVEKADTALLQEMATKPVKNYMDLLAKYKKQTPSNTGLTEHQKLKLKLEQDRLDLLKEKENRLKQKDKFYEDLKGRLSDKEIEKVVQFDEGDRILTDIDNLLAESPVSDYLGFWSSNIENAKAYLPGVEQNPDFIKMKQLTGIQLADYVKSISGAAVSEEEAQRLRRNIPNIGDKPGEFKIKLDTFKRELAEAKKSFLESAGKQKKSAEKFKTKIDPKIQQYADQYKLTYQQAESILRKRGYGK